MRDLHDVALQDLSVVVQELQVLQSQREDPKLGSQLGRTTNGLRRVAQGLRGPIYDLRSEEGEGFVSSLKSVVEYNRRLSTEREVTLEVAECFPEDLPHEMGVELLRILQEALANARRHSKARTVRVSLGVEEGGTLAGYLVTQTMSRSRLARPGSEHAPETNVPVAPAHSPSKGICTAQKRYPEVVGLTAED